MKTKQFLGIIGFALASVGAFASKGSKSGVGYKVPGQNTCFPSALPTYCTMLPLDNPDCTDDFDRIYFTDECMTVLKRRN